MKESSFSVVFHITFYCSAVGEYYCYLLESIENLTPIVIKVIKVSTFKLLGILPKSEFSIEALTTEKHQNMPSNTVERKFSWL